MLVPEAERVTPRKADDTRTCTKTDEFSQNQEQNNFTIHLLRYDIFATKTELCKIMNKISAHADSAPCFHVCTIATGTITM